MIQTSESQFTLQVVPAVYSDVGAFVPSAAKHFSVVDPEVHVAKVDPRVPHLHCPSLVSQVFTSVFTVWPPLVRHDPALHCKITKNICMCILLLKHCIYNVRAKLKNINTYVTFSIFIWVCCSSGKIIILWTNGSSRRFCTFSTCISTYTLPSNTSIGGDVRITVWMKFALKKILNISLEEMTVFFIYQNYKERSYIKKYKACKCLPGK